MAKPKHPSRRYRIRTGHSLYQVGTVGLYPDISTIVVRVAVLGPDGIVETDESGELLVAAPPKVLEAQLTVAAGEWVRYYVFFSRRKATSFAARLQLKINAHYHKAGAL